MESIEHILNFSDNFLTDQTLETTNENVIWVLIDKSQTTFYLLKNETEEFWKNCKISKIKFDQYKEMIETCQLYIENLKQKKNMLIGKLTKKLVLKEIKEKEEDSFITQSHSIDFLKSLLMKLRIEYNHHQNTINENNLKTMFPQIEENTFKINEIISIQFFEYVRLLKKIQKSDSNNFWKNETEKVKIQKLIDDFDEDKLVSFVWQKRKNNEKMLKLLKKIIKNCCFLYSEKIVQSSNSLPKERDISCDPIPSSKNPNYSLFKISHDFSKITRSRSFKYNESFYQDINEVFEENNELVFKQNKKKGETQKENYRKSLLELKELNNTAGNCYCNIF